MCGSGGGLTHVEREAEQPPLPVDGRKEQLEVDLHRDGGEEPRHPHHPTLDDLRQNRELRLQHRHSGEVEALSPLAGEDLAQPRRRVGGLEPGCSEVAQDRVVAGHVGMVQGQQGGADQDQDTVLVDLSGVGLRGRECLYGWRGR